MSSLDLVVQRLHSETTRDLLLLSMLEVSRDTPRHSQTALSKKEDNYTMTLSTLWVMISWRACSNQSRTHLTLLPLTFLMQRQ